MAKNWLIAVFVLLSVCVASSNVQHDCVADCYTSQIGVREATGKNDGPAVEMYLRSVNLGKGYAWCAAFVKWVFQSCNVKTTITAWSPTAHNSRNLIWFKKQWHKEPVHGDVFTIWNVKMKRISHTGFFHKKVNGSIYETVEGNTNEGGSREGDGVYKRRRSFNATYSITRWI